MSDTPTILIVEDDPVFRRVLSFTVAKSGLIVETANHGGLGFDRLMKGGIDFLVTDLQMPICSGLELLERLEAVNDFKRPSTILCTAKGLELDSEMLMKRFALAAIMHKPFSPRKLTEAILGHLQANGADGKSTGSPSNQQTPTAPPIVTPNSSLITPHPPSMQHGHG